MNKIRNWKERVLTVKAGFMNNINMVLNNANIIQISNRKASGGGTVYGGAALHGDVSASMYEFQVQQGQTGTYVKPYSIESINLYTDSAQDIQIILTEIEYDDLGVVFNASQLMNIQGNVNVAQPVSVTTDNEQTVGASTPSKAIYIAGSNSAGQTTPPIVDTFGDQTSNDFTKFGVGSFGLGYNELSWDRWRNNTEGTLLANATRTSIATSPVVTNYNAKGIALFLDVTAASGTGGLTVHLEGISSITGTNFDIAVASTPITVTGTHVYLYYPGISFVPGAGTQTVKEVFSTTIPRRIISAVGTGDGSSYTYSLGYSLIL